MMNDEEKEGEGECRMVTFTGIANKIAIDPELLEEIYYVEDFNDDAAKHPHRYST